MNIAKRFGAEIWLVLLCGVGCGEVAEEVIESSTALTTNNGTDEDAGLPPGVEPPRGTPIAAEDAPEEPQGIDIPGPQLDFGEPSDAAEVVPGYIRGTVTQFVPNEASAAFGFEQEVARIAKRATDSDPTSVLARYVRRDDVPVSFVELSLAQPSATVDGEKALFSWNVHGIVAGPSVPDTIVIEESARGPQDVVCNDVFGVVGRNDLGLVEQLPDGRYRFLRNLRFEPAHFTFIDHDTFRPNSGNALSAPALLSAASQLLEEK